MRSLPVPRALRADRAPFLCIAAALALGSGAGGPAAAARAPTAPKSAQRLDLAPAQRPAGDRPATERRATERPAADRLADGERPVVRDHRDLFLEVPVRPGDTWAALAARYLVDLRDLRVVREDPDRPLPPVGGFVPLPYSSLGDRYKVRVIRELFPEDGPREGNWVHRAGAGRLEGRDDTLWNLALWLTGRGENFSALADRNDLPGLIPARDQELLIPGELLLPPFAALAGLSAASPGAEASTAEAPADDFTEVPDESDRSAPPSGPRPAPGGAAADSTGQLVYGSDATGPYARYRLKRGEALYSVVIRFTGRIDSQDVNELALAVAARSGIRDVTGIPAGHGVKIPLDDLLPEYLPAGDPRRQAWEASRAKVERYTNPSLSRNLSGVTVILDAGHGGRDRGAAHNGIAEHEYVYDILCRIKDLLERGTSARVLTTIKDRREGYRVRDATVLARNQSEFLLTDPPFSLTEAYVGVNLRWYLTNSYFRKLVSEGSDPLKVVFTSLHADARHPGVGGAMVYVPGEEFRRGRYGYSGPVYARTRQVQEKPYVSFSRAERERSEGLSRQFARVLVGSFRAQGVSVHPYDPVRESIIRKRREWVPAVLRCSEVPVEILVEVSNLSNLSDSRQLAEPAYRQKIAEAYVDALERYYAGSAPRPPAPRGVASRGR